MSEVLTVPNVEGLLKGPTPKEGEDQRLYKDHSIRNYAFCINVSDTFLTKVLNWSSLDLLFSAND